MISVSRSRWAGIDSWAGQGIYSLAGAIEEGMCLCAVMENSETKATVLASPSEGDIFLGLAYNYYSAPASMIAVETYTVPSAPGPYTIALANTPLNGTTAVLAKDSTGQVYAYNGSHGSDQYAITDGTVTLDSSAAGKVITFTYAYTPTVSQVQYAYGDGVAGATTASAVTGTIGLIRRGLVYTSNFDPVVDWGSLPTALSVGDAGIVSIDGDVEIKGYVYEAPSVDSPYLGIVFSAP